MRARTESSESGVVLAVVLMVLAALSLLAVAGSGDVALQWLQVRNAREYAEAVRLAETGVGMALSGPRGRAPVVAGFMLLAAGEPDAELPEEIEVCRAEDDCPDDAAKPPVRRYWREDVE